MGLLLAWIKHRVSEEVVDLNEKLPLAPTSEEEIGESSPSAHRANATISRVVFASWPRNENSFPAANNRARARRGFVCPYDGTKRQSSAVRRLCFSAAAFNISALPPELVFAPRFDKNIILRADLGWEQEQV